MTLHDMKMAIKNFHFLIFERNKGREIERERQKEKDIERQKERDKKRKR